MKTCKLTFLSLMLISLAGCYSDRVLEQQALNELESTNILEIEPADNNTVSSFPFPSNFQEAIEGEEYTQMPPQMSELLKESKHTVFCNTK